jgi:hypothetical protein
VCRFKFADVSVECTTSVFVARRVIQTSEDREAMARDGNSKFLRSFYQTIRHRIEEDSTIQSHRREIVTSTMNNVPLQPELFIR